MSTEIRYIKAYDEHLIRTLFAHIKLDFITPNRNFFNSERNILLVAFASNKPVGFLYAYLLEDLKSNRSSIFLYSIDVFEGFRQKGIGTMLIEYLKDCARIRHCRKVFVLTENINLPAMQLYEKTGGVRQSPDDVLFVYS